MTESSSLLSLTEAAIGELADAFPDAKPGIRPSGSRILVQIRSPKTKTKSGIILTTDTQETEKWNTQIAKVIALGPIAFKSRDTGAEWTEGSWCHVGDYIRCLRYGGDRWQVEIPGREPALFMLINDLEVMGVVEGDPLMIKAYL